MPWWVWAVLVLSLVGSAARRRSGSGIGCSVLGHDWGMAVADASWDQKCRRCGVWRSGYGERW